MGVQMDASAWEYMDHIHPLSSPYLAVCILEPIVCMWCKI